MALREQHESPDAESGYPENSRRCTHTVTVFDHLVELWVAGNDLAVAQRPMASASSAGSGRADDGAPQDNQDVVGKNDPGQLAKPLNAGRGETGRKRGISGGNHASSVSRS